MRLFKRPKRLICYEWKGDIDDFATANSFHSMSKNRNSHPSNHLPTTPLSQDLAPPSPHLTPWVARHILSRCRQECNHIMATRSSCPGLKNFIQNRHAINAHQLVASGLQGVWSYFVKAFLENVFLPSNAIYNIMSNSAKRYNANNAYLTPK